MWTELNCRKIPTIWKMWIEPRCWETSTIWKERKFWFDRIVGKFQQFERCVLNWIVGKYLQFERCVKENCDDYMIWKEWFFMWIWRNCRKIPTVWNLWIELNCKKIPMIWKIWTESNCRKIPTIWSDWTELWVNTCDLKGANSMKFIQNWWILCI